MNLYCDAEEEHFLTFEHKSLQRMETPVREEQLTSLQGNRWELSSRMPIVNRLVDEGSCERGTARLESCSGLYSTVNVGFAQYFRCFGGVQPYLIGLNYSI